jgi:hypothetical protein
MKIIHDAKKLGLDTTKKIYECTICQKLFNWDENSSWFGTLKQWEEQPKKLKYFCSEQCEKKHEILKQK